MPGYGSFDYAGESRYAEECEARARRDEETARWADDLADGVDDAGGEEQDAAEAQEYDDMLREEREEP